MSAWWHDLSVRERLLVMIAGALAGILLLSLGVVRPLTQWRASAERSASMARDAYALTAAAAAIGGGGLQKPVSAQAPMRDSLIAASRSAGIELVRLGAENNGQLEIQIETVSGDIFFNWLAELENRYGLTLASADITRGEDGKVTPQVLVFKHL